MADEEEQREFLWKFLFEDVLLRIPFEAYQALDEPIKTQIDNLLVGAFIRRRHLSTDAELNRTYWLIQLESSLFATQALIRKNKPEVLNGEKALILATSAPFITAKGILASVTGGKKSGVSVHIEDLSKASKILSEVMRMGFSFSSYVEASDEIKQKVRRVIVDRLSQIAGNYPNYLVMCTIKMYTTTEMRNVHGPSGQNGPPRTRMEKATRSSTSSKKILRQGVTQDQQQYIDYEAGVAKVSFFAGIFRLPSMLFHSHEELAVQLKTTFAEINALLQPKQEAVIDVMRSPSKSSYRSVLMPTLTFEPPLTSPTEATPKPQDYESTTARAAKDAEKLSSLEIQSEAERLAALEESVQTEKTSDSQMRLVAS